MRRGDIWRADLGQAAGSAPAKTRPVLVLQADSFNDSLIATVIVVAITTNPRLAEAPGNVLLTKRTSKLRHPSVVNVSQVATINKSALRARVGSLNKDTMELVRAGLRLSMDL